MDTRVMDRPALVVDLDNTILDTSHRKRVLLTRHFSDGESPTLEAVRADYRLTSVLGDPASEFYRTFFRELDSTVTISTVPAPPFDGAVGALNSLDWCDVFIVTGRPNTAKETTLKELAKIGLETCAQHLICFDGEMNEASREHLLTEFKAQVVRDLTSSREVVAVIGDQPSDFRAAHQNHVPCILLRSTLSLSEIDPLYREDHVGLDVCESWAEIESRIAHLREGAHEMRRLREMLTSQYSAWLKDIDDKARLVVTVAAAVATVSGSFLLRQAGGQAGEAAPVSRYCFVGSLLLATVSMLYAIRAFTSRYIGGAAGGKAVGVRVRQWVSVLLGWPDRWTYREGDAIDEYRRLRESSVTVQAQAHVLFFRRRYRTHHPRALLNLRMFELRQLNYAKIYPERIASQLLAVSILSLLVGVMFEAGVFNWLARAICLLVGRSV